MPSNINFGKIYIITSNVSNLSYIGSTLNPLKLRLSVHKSQCKRFINGHESPNLSVFKIFELGGDINIKLLENVQ